MSEAFPKNAGTYTVVAKNSAGEGQCSANVSVKVSVLELLDLMYSTYVLVSFIFLFI